MLVSFQIGAKSISIHGYGNSTEEARYNASVELNRYIFGEHVISLSEVETEDNGRDIVSDTFKESISISTDGDLIGVMYSNAVSTVGDESIYGKYKVTASIPEAHSSMYAERLLVTAKSIDAIYSQTTETIEAKKAKLLNLMLEIQKYDNLRQVAIVLGLDPSEIVSYEAPVTYQSVSTELQSILIDQETSITNEKLSQRDQFAIIELNAKLDANRKEQEALREQQELNIKIAQEMALQSIRERVNSVISNNAFRNSGLYVEQVESSVNTLIEDVLIAQKSWNTLHTEYESMLEQEFSRIDSSLKAELEALENKAYRTAEMSNGKPIDRAVEYRLREIEDLKNQKRDEKKNVEELITSGFKGSLESSWATLNSCIEKLNSAEFVYSSIWDGITYTFDYDGNNCVWNFNFELNTGFDNEILKEVETEEVVTDQLKAIYNPVITGSFFSENWQQIEISYVKSWTTIYYTIDGSTPDFDDYIYKGTFNVSNGRTVKARAYKDGAWSDVVTYEVGKIKSSSVNIPTIKGVDYYNDHQKITIDCGTSGATIYYTTDDTTPNTSDEKYTGPLIIIKYGTTIKARAYKNGVWSDIATYKVGEYIDTSLSTITTYEVEEDSDISLSTDITDIIPKNLNIGKYSFPYETLSGKKPTSPPIDNKDKVAENAWNEYLNDVDYYNDLLQLSYYEFMVTINVIYDIETDTFIINIVDVTMENGTNKFDPIEDESKYERTDNILFFKNKTVTTTPYWVSDNDNNTDNELFDSLSIVGSYYSSQYQKITINSNVIGADIYYTTDGTLPNNYKIKYSGPFYAENGTTVKACIYKDGLRSEFANYNVSFVVKPTITESYYSQNKQRVNISCSTPGAIIYHTTDGKTPNRYSSSGTSILMANGTTVKARAYKDGYWSDIVTYEVGNIGSSSINAPTITGVDDYQDVLTVIEDGREQQEIETKKEEDVLKRKENYEYLKKKLSLDLEVGVKVTTLPEVDNEIMVSLKAPLLVNVGRWFRFGFVPELDFGVIDLSGVLFEAEGVFKVYAGENRSLFLSTGVDFGFSSESVLFSYYLGTQIDKVRLQAGLSVMGSVASGASYTSASISVRLVDIF